jgi:hypothetical protein
MLDVKRLLGFAGSLTERDQYFGGSNGDADSTGQLVWLQAAGCVVLWKSYFHRDVVLRFT